MNMKKVMVIGCPGSGKSTFSKALHEMTELPLFHLDMFFWNADKTTVERSVFLERLSGILEQNAWIVDGDYASTMELRMQACDTVIFLDYPLEVCLNGIAKRRGKKRSDIPWIETETDEEFLSMVKNYETQRKPRVIELLERYRHKNIIVLKSREQADKFLSDLKQDACSYK